LIQELLFVLCRVVVETRRIDPIHRIVAHVHVQIRLTTTKQDLILRRPAAPVAVFVLVFSAPTAL
jgi:hypothetical protein